MVTLRLVQAEFRPRGRSNLGHPGTRTAGGRGDICAQQERYSGTFSVYHWFAVGVSGGGVYNRRFISVMQSRPARWQSEFEHSARESAPESLRPNLPHQDSAHRK